MRSRDLSSARTVLITGRAWLELAQTPADRPIPEHVDAYLRSIAQRIAWLAARRCPVPAKKAAAQAARVAGLTGRAIDRHRAEQDAIWTSMLFRAQARNDGRSH